MKTLFGNRVFIDVFNKDVYVWISVERCFLSGYVFAFWMKSPGLLGLGKALLWEITLVFSPASGIKSFSTVLCLAMLIAALDSPKCKLIVRQDRKTWKLREGTRPPLPQKSVEATQELRSKTFSTISIVLPLWIIPFVYGYFMIKYEWP